MRLTLRTLLAYLDDNLEPAEAKDIGQKVAESETAQQLITRIKEVTRRRRITTPPPGPDPNVDPNSVAEYLDNELTPEALADLERLALASDVYLAELAACHEILTVVLGEPAMVPPTAYQRMYGLVKPPESNHRHAPPKARAAVDGLTERKDVDETLRLGIPALHSGNWTNRLLLLGGTICILLLLVLAIWQLLPQGRDVWDVATGKLVASGKPPLLSPKVDKPIEVPGKPAVKEDKPEAKEKQPDPVEKPAENKDKPAEPKKGGDDPPAPPNLKSRTVGHFEPGRDAAVLLQLLPDKNQPDRRLWTRLVRSTDPASSQVMSNAPLVSLPGYRSVVQLDSGARLTLWGNVPEISFFPVAIESVVTIHGNDQFDLDLTLGRGRIAVANQKEEPLKVRLRFANPANPVKDEVWDLILHEKGTEVIVNLAGLMPPGEPFYPAKDTARRLGPIAVVVLLAPRGSATLKVDLQAPDKLTPPPQGPLVIWNSQQGRHNLVKIDSMPPWVQPLPPLPKEAEIKAAGAARAAVLAALESLNIALTGSAVDVGLFNASKTNDIHKKRLVVRCAGALDDLARVVEALEDKELEVRRAAIETLRIWIGAGRDNDYALFAQLQPKYSEPDAQIVMTLLHGFAPPQEADPSIAELLVKYLMHNKPAVRELAHDYLLRLFPSGQTIGYNALAPDNQVRQSAADWQKLVQKSKK